MGECEFWVHVIFDADDRQEGGLRALLVTEANGRGRVKRQQSNLVPLCFSVTTKLSCNAMQYNSVEFYK